MDLSNARWRKATRSTNNGGQCVEIAGLPGIIAVRDSKNPGGPALVFGRAAFRTFASQLKQQP
jgi:hypothetical protein